MIRHVRYVVIALALSCATQSRVVQDPAEESVRMAIFLSQPERLTAGPYSDFSPSMSQSGTSIFFTSDRSGNKDIWKKPLNGGMPTQLTKHVADDYHVAVDHQGQRIAFVSRRDDALGDLYVSKKWDFKGFLGLKRGQEASYERVSLPNSEEAHPAWHPDGKRLVFTSRPYGASEGNLMLYDLDQNKVQRVGNLVGGQPSFSSDGRLLVYERGGALYIYEFEREIETRVTEGGRVQDGQAHFERGSYTLVFVRYVDDTNADRVLNGDDRPTIWRLSLGPEGEAFSVKNKPWATPLSTSQFGAYAPMVDGSWVYLAGETSDGLSLFRIPYSGQIKVARTLSELDQSLQSLSDPEARILAIRAAAARFYQGGQRHLAGWTSLMELTRHVDGRREAEAAVLARRVQEDLGDDLSLVARVQEELIRLKLRAIEYPEKTGELSQREQEMGHQLLTQVEALLKDWREPSHAHSEGSAPKHAVRGEGLLLKAKILASLGRYVEALGALDEAVQAPGLNESTLIRMKTLKGRLALETADRDTAIDLLVQVVREYRASPALSAIEETARMAVAVASGDEEGKEALIRLRDKSRGLPILPALAHWEMAKILDDDKHQKVFANELRSIADQYEESPAIRLKAAREFSRVTGEVDQTNGTEDLLLSLRAGLARVDPEIGRQVDLELKEFYIRRGTSFLRVGRTKDAILSFEKAKEIDPLDLNVHRGLIAARFLIGETNAVIREYELLQQNDPDAFVYTYLVGYASSYRIDEAKDEVSRLSEIDRCLEILESARERGGQFAQVHQTLGWLYLQRGYWGDRLESGGSWRGEVSRRSRIAQDFFGGSDTNWFEKALDSFQSAYFLSSRGSIERANLAQNLGQAFYDLKNYKKSLDFFMERIAALPHVPMRDPRLEGLLFRRAGRAAFQIQDLDSAASLQGRALAIWEQIGDRTELEYSLSALALTLADQKNWEKAEYFYKQLRPLQEARGPSPNLVGTYTNLGMAAYYQAHYSESLDYFAVAEDGLGAMEAVASQNTVNKGDGAIKLDLTGQASAAKGFSPIQRHILIETFRNLIYRAQGREDLQREALRAKLKWQREEAQRVKATPDSELEKGIGITTSQLAHLEADLGALRESVQGYRDAAQSIKAGRSSKEGPPEKDEIAMELSLARLSMRRAALHDLDAAESQEAQTRLRKTFEGLASDPAWKKERTGSLVFEVATALVSMQRLMGENPDRELVAALRESLAQIEARAPLWQRAYLNGDLEKAFDLLTKYVTEEDGTLTLVGRANLRTVTEALLVKQQGHWSAMESTLRRFLRIRLLDIGRRGGLFTSSAEISKSPDGDWVRILSGSLEGAETEGRDAGEQSPSLLVHRTSSGQGILLLRTSGQLRGKIVSQLSLATTSLQAALQELDLAGTVPEGAPLYLVPSGDVYEGRWEEVLVAGQRLDQRYRLGFLPTPELVTAFEKRRFIRRDRFGMLAPKSQESSPPKFVDGLDTETWPLAVGTDSTQSFGRLAQVDVLQVSHPVILSEIEPGVSSLGDPVSVTKGEPIRPGPITLSSLCTTLFRQKRVVILANIYQYPADHGRHFAGDDGWIYASLCGLRNGLASLVLGQAMPESSQTRSPRVSDSQDPRESAAKDRVFFQNLVSGMGISTALRDWPRARLIGDLGFTDSEELSFSKAHFGESLESAEDAYDEGAFAQAVSRFRDALYQARLIGSKDVRSILDGLVKALYQMRDYSEAFRYQVKKIQSLEASQSGSEGQVQYGMAVIEAAVLAVRAQFYKEAERYLGEAQILFEGLGDSASLGKIAQYRAINAENQSLYQETIRFYQVSYDYYTKVNRSEAAKRLLNIGNIYNLRLSDMPKALDYYQRAKEEFKKLDDDAALISVQIDEANTRMAMGQLEVGIAMLENEVIPGIDISDERDLWVRSHQILANAYLRSARYEDSRILNEKIIVEAEKISDPRDPNKAYQRLLDAWSLRAYLLSIAGDRSAAFGEFERAIGIARERDLQAQLALLYNNYGYWLREFGDFDRSIEMLEKAEGVDRALKSRAGLAVDRRNLALSLMARGDVVRSASLLKDALKESEELFLAYNVAHCHFGLGDLAARREDWAEAENHFKKALATAEKGSMPELGWRAHGGIGQVYLRRGQYPEAIVELSQAVHEIEQREGGLKAGPSRVAYLSDPGVQEIYESLVFAQMKVGEIEAAWVSSERARARAFLDTIGPTRHKYQGFLKDTKRDQGQLEDFVRVHPPNLKDIVGIVPEGTIILDYFVTKTAVIIWVLKNRQLLGYMIDVKESFLASMIEDYRTIFEKLSAPRYLGLEISRYLIKPIEPHLQGASEIVVVPHKYLHFVSFASLYFGDTYLVDLAPVSYLDSVKMARYLWGSPQKLGKGSKVLALAYPKADGETDLRFVEKEVQAIRRYFPATDVRGAGSRGKEILWKGTDSFSVLHLASHGRFDAHHPLQSSLSIGGDSSDQRLTVEELLGMPRQAGLVTLSACESGMGALSSGQEMISMNRAFALAGARTVVSSLWRISDVASAVVMKRFYRSLATGMGPARAMREAQGVTRKYFEHPAYWSSYRVMGQGW